MDLEMYLLRKLRKHGLYIIVLLFVIYQGFSTWFIQNKFDPFEDGSTRGKLSSYKKEIQFLQSVLKKYNVPEEEYMQGLLPVIYIITPTYARPQQEAELNRLRSVFLTVPSVHWILVEDSSIKTKLVENFLGNSGIPHTHLNVATPDEWKLKRNDPRWYKPRGVLQRNAGINWLRTNIHVKTASGVVYFADDDNTYTAELFSEMRWTKKVSIWPVGLVGGLLVEKPKVERRKVVGWNTVWRPDRPFATDMAGFAVNLSILLMNNQVQFSLNSKIGFMESDFLKEFVTLENLEPKANGCTKVLVWHTRTETPDLKHEKSYSNG